MWLGTNMSRAEQIRNPGAVLYQQSQETETDPVKSSFKQRDICTFHDWLGS